MRRKRATKAELRLAMRRQANETRDCADEMARMFGGCDDPLWPWAPASRRGKYDNWLEFVDLVARPIAESDDDREIQDAMRMYRQECPHYICAALVLAANRHQNYLDNR